ncbi:hypothetical protein TTHERM_00158380 (macronuclear) [Tetrahymena thermophila SB210]|uniref:Uncharacterized protein n=1 Tax=Tetrahymena thermophila (strain SB210) TaxID=312017 RepID=Q22W96_TETTS|nr:hypothetical protein TTHERM_00158380 [Tetrahymena thermophila SB210]EAR89521.1 hypothetical protein TTHERM_00158380 [Tetrahymena thermophila SB210]|eukprot:XP_001009766.1 hypothetical protein TTHERM_00158380 [Tetrahymena thermophila SB210]
MSSQGKRQDKTNDSASGQDLDQDQKKNNVKNPVSKNKRGSSHGPSNKKMDIWHRNEMEKHRKMMEQNQKRMKENTLKEKNEQEKADKEQQEILEKLKKEKKEQYEKYLKTNIRQNDINYQKQKPAVNIYKSIDIINGVENANKLQEDNDNKKMLKQWVPRPVPLEDAEKHLKQQKIEQELYENQMKQMELVQLLEEKKMLDMYKNLPKPKNQKRNSNQDQENINEEDEYNYQSGSFSGVGQSNLYVDSENESQVRKKMKKNESSQLKENSPSYVAADYKKKNKNNKEDYLYNQEISIVQDKYDINGGDRTKTPDMLGFEVYNQNYKAKIQSEQNAKKNQESQQSKNKEKQNSQGKKENSPSQNNKQKKEQNAIKQKDQKKSDNYGEWKFDEGNSFDNKQEKEPFVQKVLPNGMTNHHKEVALSKNFQKIQFELDGQEEEEEVQEVEIGQKNDRSQVFQNIQNKPSTSQSGSGVKNQIQDKQSNQSEIKRQLDQKEMELLKQKQEQLIKQKKEQKQKESEMDKQKQQYLSQFYKQDTKNQDSNQENKEQILKEFKNQFNDLKKQYNYHRQITNQSSKSNLQTTTNENNAEQETQQKGNKIDNKKNQRYDQQPQIKSPQPEQDEYLLEQADFDNELMSKQSQMNNSGKVVKRTNYLKDVSKFSMKPQPPAEKPSYSKNQKERRKFWERKTNEDFLNQSIEEKATFTAISKFKSKLQNNINIDKQLNNEEKQNISPEKAEKKKELEEWQKINEQEVKLQKEILKIHLDNLEKVKDVEEKNQINTSQNISQMIENKSKSRINTATSNKSAVTQKTTKTNKTTTHKDHGGHKNAINQINPISEIENEDDIEASLMNLDNQLSNQKNRITLMTAEIEQSLKPKHPQLRKEILNNPQMLQQNPFTVDITSLDKDYLEEEKQKFFTPIQQNHKQSKLNISHISSVSNQKELLGNRPVSNKTSITNSQFNSLAVIPPHFNQQNQNSQSHSNFQDKLPKINQNHIQSIEPLQDKSRIEIQKQNTTNSQIQRSKNQSRQSSNQSSIVTVPIQKNQNEGQNNIITQKKNIDSKDKVMQIKNKEMELKKKFPEFFSEEDQQDVTPKMKQKQIKEQNQIVSHNQIQKQQIDNDSQERQIIQNVSVQQSESASRPNRQESSRSLNKKKQVQQELPQLNHQVVEQDKEDLKQWWKSVQKSIEKSYENTPSQKFSDDKNSPQGFNEEKQGKNEQIQSKNISHKQKRELDQERQSLKVQPEQNNDDETINQQAESKEQNIQKEQQNKQNQITKEQQIALNKEERKKMIMKKFLEECEEDEQNNEEKKQQNNFDFEKNNLNENVKLQNEQPKKKLIEIQFEQNKAEPKKSRRIKNNDGIEINESEIMSDNFSVVSKKNGEESSKNNRKEFRNFSGKSNENLQKIKESKSRQKSADSSNTHDSRSKIVKQLRDQSSNQSSPTNPSKKRVEKVLDKNVIAKVEQQQQQIEQAIKQTLEKLEQAEIEQLHKEQEKQKVNITKRKSNVSSNNSNVEKELSEISHNYSFAESDISHLTGNGNYATRQVIKKNYIVTGKVPSRYNHENLYPSKNKSTNNSFNDNASNMSSSKFIFQKENMHDSKLVLNNQSNIQSKAVIPENKDIIDEEEYQGDIKINRNVNLQKLLFVD